MVLLKFSDGSKHNIPLKELQIIPYFKTLPTLKDDSQELDLSFNGIFTYSNIIRCIALSEPLTDSCEELMDYFCIDNNFYDKNYVNKMLKLDLNNKEEDNYNTIISRCQLEPIYLPNNCKIIFEYPIEVVKKCITRDNVNIYNYHGNTILIEASKHNEYTEIVKHIIKNGANINITDSHNKTALIHASNQNQIRIVGVLIRAGANVNYQEDIYQYTALIRASEKNNIEIVDLLIKAGANVNHLTRNGFSALQYPCSSNTGYVEIVKLLIDAGIDVNTHYNSNRTTCFMIASERGHIEIVRLFIDAGVDVNFADNLGKTALIYACSKGHRDTVELLIRAGADVNYHTHETALIASIISKDNDTVELLINAGANVNASNSFNDTPLTIATDYGNKKLVEQLIKAGANVNAKNSVITALELALRTNKTEIAKILKEAGAK